MSCRRLNLYVAPEHAQRLSALATMRGVTKSSLVALALTSYLSPEALDVSETGVAKRLDKLSRQFSKLERDQNILIEAFALFVRHTLASNPPVQEDHQEAARLRGRDRFAHFVEQLGAHLQDGHSLVRELHETVAAEPHRRVRSAAQDGTANGKGGS